MNSEQLIEAVRKYEVLYNKQCADYRDAKHRNAAWAEVARRCGRSVDECKEEWGKLRNCYTNSIKRRQRREMPPWRLEDAMSFLKPFVECKYRPHDATEGHYDEDSCDSDRPAEDEPKAEVLFMGPSGSTYKRKPTEEVYLPDVLGGSQEATQATPGSDDTDHFFLSMSKMVKKLPRLDQIRIKLDLHKAISEAEIKQLESKDHIV